MHGRGADMKDRQPTRDSVAGSVGSVRVPGVGKRSLTDGMAGPADADRETSKARPNRTDDGSAAEGLRRGLPPAIPGGFGETFDLDSSSDGGVAAVAEERTTGRALPGPVRGELEAALGADLSAVRVHDDDRASELAQLYDALAVAQGQDLYFSAGSYDPSSAAGRHLLAHEVAHAVQAHGKPATAARSRTTTPTDGAELEAETFASSFAQHGAEARTVLRERLDAGAVARVGIEGIVSEPPRPEAGAGEPKGATAADWVGRFAETLVPLVAAHLRGAAYPTGHARLRWIAEGIAGEVWQTIASADDLYAALARVLAPIDVAAVVDGHRTLGERARSDGRRVGPLEWTPGVALAVASEIDRSAMASLGRVGPRVVASLDALAVSTGNDDTSGPRPTSLLTAGNVISSHPMDAVIVRALSRPDVAEVLPAVAGASAAPPVRALRRVEYVWHDDAQLWNWIRVVEPVDATVEEVATTALGSPEEAFRVHGAAPFFALPPEEASRRAPARAQAGLAAAAADAAGPFAGVAAMVAVAQGAKDDRLAAGQGGEAAGLVQAHRAVGPGTGAPEGVHADSDPAALGAHCQVQLAVLVERYAELGVGALVAPAITRLVGRNLRLSGLPTEERARFGTLFAAQSAVLGEVTERLDGVLRQVDDQRRALQRDADASLVRARVAAELDGRSAPPAAPVDLSIDPALGAVARELAGAAAVSDMPDLARQRLAAADARQEALAFENLEAMLSDARQRLATAQPELAAHGPNDAPARMSPADVAAEVGARQDGLSREVLDARRSQAAGSTDGDEMRRLHERVRAAQVEARLVSHVAQLGAMAQRLEEKKGVRQTVALNESDLAAASRRLQRLRNDMHGVLSRWRAANASLDATTAARASTPDDGQAARNSVAGLESELRGLGDAEARQALQVAVDELSDAMWVELGFDIAAMIGVGLVSGQIVGAAGAALRGWRLGRAGLAAMELSKEAQVAGRVAGLVAEAGLNAAGHTALQGGGGAEAFADNLLGDAATLAVLGPLQRAFAVWGAADAAAIGLWSKVNRGGKLALRAGVEISAMTITGAASGYVAHRLAAGGPVDEQTTLDWAVQGASIAIGKLLHSRLKDFNEQLDGFATEVGYDAGHLRRRSVVALAKAEKLQQTGRPDDALALLAEDARLRSDELRELEALAASRDAADGARPSQALLEHRIDTLRADGKSAVAAFPELPLRLAGLKPIAAGVLTGDAARIDDALAQARELGVDVEVLGYDKDAGRWKLRLDQQRVELIERRAISLVGDDADAARVTSWVTPVAGTLDVVVHGGEDDFQVRRNGEKLRVDHRGLATYIRKSGHRFHRVRLLSCRTGKHATGVAQHLANALGVPVSAPSDDLHVRDNGEMVIGPTDTQNTGKWEEFLPAPSDVRMRWLNDEPTPERAIDRHRRARRAHEATNGDDRHGPASVEPDVVELGGGPEPLPEPAARPGLSDDLTAHLAQGDARAAQVRRRVDGPAGEALAQVEQWSVRADVQVEADLRVMDPLFGSQARNAFKSAAARLAHGGQSEADALVAAEQRARFEAASDLHDAQMSEMLRVLQDPAMPASAKRAELLDRIDRLEEAVVVARIDAAAIDFDGARAAVRALERDSPSGQLVLDGSGNLLQGGAPAGSFRDLMTRVTEANQVYRDEGVPREFVIGVTSPVRPDAPRKVVVLSRARAVVAAGEPLPPKLPPLHSSVDPASDGLVVDIGVGESSYALDMLPAGDHRALVVGTEYGPSYLDAAMTRRDLTWEHTAPRIEADSAIVIGDALQTLPLLFGPLSVNRLFINNINAGYEGATSAEYSTLATGLRTVMRRGGQVEVQWDMTPEYPDRPNAQAGDRQHIDGPTLEAALQATANVHPRGFTVRAEDPIADYPYSVEATRRRGGAEKDPPKSPVPGQRWIIVFE
jgi:hypothetical protein